MKSSIEILLVFFAFTQMGFAQKSEESQQHATLITKAVYVKRIPSLASQIANGQLVLGEDIVKEVNPKRRGANMAVPGKGLPKGNDPLWNVNKNSFKIKGKEPIIAFETASSGATPTDPTGAVGPSHYVNAWNSRFRIWDKEGNALTPPASLGTIFPGETLGDPIVFYDAFADRFVITQFSNTPNGFLVAVCQGSDPVNDGWFTYRFNVGSAFPDYPKFTVWSDGYYITANKNSGSAGSSQVVFAIERDKMLTGETNAQMVGFPLTGISTNGFYSPLGFNANGETLPDPGNAPIVYMQDDAWSGVSTDHLKIWSINVDWDAPANSTISTPQILNTTAFDGLFDGGSFSNLPQSSGPDIDALQATIMYMAQYRRFEDYNAVVFNFVVDLDGNDDLAGIRWYELRQDNDGDPWSIYQEGTYSQPDGHSAFAGSIAMDVSGNIGLGYTVVSATQVPSIRYTGRMFFDPLGEMTVEEEIIEAGSQNNPAVRYGDYAQLTIDPTDEKTFWHTGEYFASGTRKDVVGAFKIAPNFAKDVGIVSLDTPSDAILSDSEPITITVRNFGVDTVIDIPVSYQINEGSLINDTIIGSFPAGSVAQYTFVELADLSVVGETYSITTSTAFEEDENHLNDTLIVQVTNLETNDLGITGIISPVSGIDLSETESITVIINNFGGEAQSDFDVSYSLNGASPVTEQVSETLDPLDSINYTFSETADFSAIGSHMLTAFTSLEQDADLSNDTNIVFISKELCQPNISCDFGNGFRLFKLGEINNVTGCEPGGYGDFTFLSTNLDQGSSNELTVTTGRGNQFVRVWIDFNDNFLFEQDEIVIDNFEIADGEMGGEFTESRDLVLDFNVALGEHIMRAKSNIFINVPDDACEATQFGETEDYRVIIDFANGIEDRELIDGDMKISYLPGNQFKVFLNPSNFDDRIIITVHDINGRKLIQNWVENVGGTYTYDIDMSYAPAGVYLVRMGTDKFGKVKRFVVN